MTTPTAPSSKFPDPGLDFGSHEMSALSPVALALVADFFKVLSEPSRLQILCVLKEESRNVSEIVEASGLGQANVSKHLKILAQAGIVSRQSQGVSAYYSIANPFIFELCNLVCNSLAIRMEQQSQPLKEFAESAHSS